MKLSDVLLALPLLLLACGDPPTEVDAGDPTDAGSDAGIVEICARLLDCDNSNYCDGAEQCLPGDPRADARGCVAGAPPCMAGQTCNEGEGRCDSDCGTEPDADGDGHDAINCGGGDCDDTDDQVNPGVEEICDDTGRDEDCNPDTLSAPSATDQDSDGYVDAACCNRQRTGAILCGLDCDDDQSAANPRQPETCDGIDNDCDAMTDEGVESTFYRDADMDLYGDSDDTVNGCAQPDGYTATSGDCDDTRPDANPAATETCNGLDDDCDMMTDEEVSPAPETPEHCGGCGLVCPEGFLCEGTMCVDAPVRLVAGALSTCAITRSGALHCWGGNAEGEVGVGSSALTVDRPRQVALPGRVASVDFGVSVGVWGLSNYGVWGCALLEDQSVFCWGTDISSRPTPQADLPAGFLPSAIPTDSRQLTSAGAGGSFVWLAQDGAGVVYRSGSDAWATTSLGRASDIFGACARQAGSGIRCLVDFAGGEQAFPELFGGTLQAGGGPSSCGTRADGRLLCWGSNLGGQIGPGGSYISSPRLISGLPSLDIASLALYSHYAPGGLGGGSAWGYGHACAAMVDGRTYCWGQNQRGELGIGTTSTSPVLSPTRVSTTERFVQLTAGYSHTCAISDVDEVWCWGGNDGVLGTADVSDALVPTRLFGFPVVEAPSAR